MDYTNQNLIENHLQRALTTDEIALLPVLKRSIKQWIDRKTNSRFDKVEASTRYYDGCEGILDIDPCTEVTAVTSVDSYQNANYTYETNQQSVEPVNQTVKNYIRKKYGEFAEGVGSMAVTAKFSEYDESAGGVPEDIQMIATALACAVITNQSDVAGTVAGVKSESIEGHSITYGADSKSYDLIAGHESFIEELLDQRREILLG